jgi:hypothetical protein
LNETKKSALFDHDEPFVKDERTTQGEQRRELVVFSMKDENSKEDTQKDLIGDTCLPFSPFFCQ